MGRFKKRWYERPIIPKINADWVALNCKLTNREKKILEHIDRRGLIRRDHLEVIHSDYRQLRKRTNVLNRSLKKLFLKHALDKAHEERKFMQGNTPAVFGMDRAGAILLNKPLRRKLLRRRVMTDRGEIIIRELPSNYRHIHGMNQLEVDTILFCEENGHDLIRWDIEEENLKTFKYDERITLTPDIFTIIGKNNGKLFLAYIEYDTGNEDFRYKNSFPTLKEKLSKYRKYKISQSWKEEDWSQKIKTSFPILIFVTEDHKRIKHVNEQAEKFGLRFKACLASEYIKVLEELM